MAAYELIHEENTWKSVVDGKTIVMASTKEACVTRTEHYLSISVKLNIPDKV